MQKAPVASRRKMILSVRSMCDRWMTGRKRRSRRRAAAEKILIGLIEVTAQPSQGDDSGFIAILISYYRPQASPSHPPMPPLGPRCSMLPIPPPGPIPWPIPSLFPIMPGP